MHTVREARVFLLQVGGGTVSSDYALSLAR